MADIFNIAVSPPPQLNITVAGYISILGGSGDIIIPSKFTGLTGLETTYTDVNLIGKLAFLAFRGASKMNIITSGTPTIEQIKVVGSVVSWDQPLNVGEEIIIIAK